MAIAIACLTIVLTLFVPGLLIASCFDCDRTQSVAIAPALSCFLVLTFGIVLHYICIDATPITMLVIPCAILAVALFIHQRYHAAKPNRVENKSRDQILILSLYILIGVFLVISIYFKHLHGLNSFQPDNDNSTHLALIKNMLFSKNMSTLSTSSYFDASARPITNFKGSFYPAVFHAIAALSIIASGINAQAAENLIAAIIISTVYTSGCYLLFRTIDSEDKILQISGAIGSLLVIGFPWRFIVWGPLYPNLLSLALIPATMSIEIDICHALINKESKGSISKNLLLFFFSIIAIAGSHPNGIFTFGVLSIPLILQTVFYIFKKRLGANKCKSVLATFIAFTAITLLWLICYKLPQMQGVVQFKWASSQTAIQALGSLLLFGFTRESNEPLLLIFLCLGIIKVARDPNRNWTILSYLITSIMFVIVVSTDGQIKQLLCGFWYCDHTRIAACVSLASVPLIAFGISLLIKSLVKIRSNQRAIATAIKVITASIAILVIVCFPFFTEGYFGKPTTFQDYKRLLDYKFSLDLPSVYSKDEVEFVNQAKKLIPIGATVLNIPFDGSCFAYDIQGINVYYRTPSISGDKKSSETNNSWLYRRKLSRYARDKEVKNALKSDNIQYVLQLDKGPSDNEPEREFASYSEKDWNGIISIDESTPGFTLISSNKDMKLYRINIK